MMRSFVGTRRRTPGTAQTLLRLRSGLGAGSSPSVAAARSTFVLRAQWSRSRPSKRPMMRRVVVWPPIAFSRKSCVRERASMLCLLGSSTTGGCTPPARAPCLSSVCRSTISSGGTCSSALLRGCGRAPRRSLNLRPPRPSLALPPPPGPQRWLPAHLARCWCPRPPRRPCAPASAAPPRLPTATPAALPAGRPPCC